MNQASTIGFGTDANQIAGYVQYAGAKLGNIDFIFENTGLNTLYCRVKQYDGTTSPSGWANVGAAFTVVPKGVVTKSFQFLNKKVGFFGSGSTTANITAVIRNKGDIRGAQIDIVPVGRRGWGYDDGFNKSELRKDWGSPPDSSTTPEA